MRKAVTPKTTAITITNATVIDPTPIGEVSSKSSTLVNDSNSVTKKKRKPEMLDLKS